MNFRRAFILKRTSFRKKGECIHVGCYAKADGFNLCGECRKILSQVLEYNRKIDSVINSGDRSKTEKGRLS